MRPESVNNILSAISGAVMALLLCWLLTGCASVPSTRHVSHIGQAADSMSTVAALNLGWVEGNPVVASNIWLLVAKPLTPALIQFMPEQSCRPLHRVFAHLGFGPALHNVALLAGASIPVAWGLAVISLPVMRDWVRRGADERCGVNNG